MTKDDVIRMAREAGLHLYVNDLTEEPYALVVERFANLVAAAEREEIAKLIEKYPYWLGTVGKREIVATIRARGTT